MPTTTTQAAESTAALRDAEERQAIANGLDPTPGYVFSTDVPPALGGQIRPGAAGTVAVPENAAPTLRASGTVDMPSEPAEPIDGARVLAQAYGWLGHMAKWPSEAALITAVLYAAASHGVDDKTRLPVYLYMPRLFFTAADVDGGSGKSRMARLTAALCPSPKRLGEMTKAALVDLIYQRHTVIVTELDTFVGTGKRNTWFPGIANLGFEFDGTTGHKVGGKTLEIPLFGAMILDGLESVIFATGTELKTLLARCIILWVIRGPKGYRAPRYDLEAQATGQAIGRRMARWMGQEVADGLAYRVPVIPEHLGNRPYDLWEPLFLAAEAAGGPWPGLARFACEHVEKPGGMQGDDAADEAAIHAALQKAGAGALALPGVSEDELLP